MKYLAFLRWNQVHLWLKRYITSGGKASMGISAMFENRKKKQFGIWVFLEVQKINFLDPTLNFNIVYFYTNFFHFTKSSFRSWSLLFDNSTMQIKLTAALLNMPANLL